MATFSFDQFKSNLVNNISPGEFSIWLKDLNFGSFKSEKLILNTSSEFKKKRIASHYTGWIQSALEEQGFPSSAYEILVISSPAQEPSAIKEPSSDKDSKNIQNKTNFDSRQEEKHIKNSPSKIGLSPSELSHGIKPELTLDNYVFSDFNKIVSAFAQKVKEQLGKISPLYIYSKVGLGKTHLIHALGNYYLKQFPFLKIKCINPNDFVGEFTKSLAEKRDRQFRLKYRSLDILLLDDIQFFIGKDKSCVEFFHIFNQIYSPGKQIIFCSDRLPEELGGIDDRLKSRLSSSAIVGIESLSKIDKEKLLSYYLNENDINLGKQVFDFIIDHLPSDIRKIVGIANTLSVYQDIYDNEITSEFCREHLKQLMFKSENNIASPEKLLLAVANASKIPMNDFKTPKRSKSLSYYRQVLMYALRNHTHLSLPEIGRFLGGKTNSTILFGVNKIAKELKSSHQLQILMDEILA